MAAARSDLRASMRAHVDECLCLAILVTQQQNRRAHDVFGGVITGFREFATLCDDVRDLSHHPTVRLESRPTSKHVSGQDEDVVSDVKSVGVDVVEHSPSHRSNEWQLTRSVLSGCPDWGKDIVEFARILEGRTPAWSCQR